MKINIWNLLEFYDSDGTAKSHSNSIKTLMGEEFGGALLEHYFRNVLRKNEAKFHPHHCTTGTRTLPVGCKVKGSWLDGWLVTAEDFYQVEIKSWSMHGIGGPGRTLTPDRKVEPDKFPDYDGYDGYARQLWDRVNGRYGRLEDGLAKVLKKMSIDKAPKTVQDLQSNTPPCHPKPLLCMWQVMTPPDKRTEDCIFFDSRISEALITDLGDAFAPTHFGWTEDTQENYKLYWFSQSAYLRSILDQETDDKNKKKATIELDLPDTERRLKYLKDICAEWPQ